VGATLSGSKDGVVCVLNREQQDLFGGALATFFFPRSHGHGSTSFDIVRSLALCGVYYRYICKVCHPTTPYSAHFRVAKPPPTYKK